MSRSLNASKDTIFLDSLLTSSRRAVALLLGNASRFLERHPSFLIAVLALIYVPAVLSDSYAKPLWHDELFTFYIAQAPTHHAMWADLRSLDLNPPLVYLLTRLSFAVFGVSTLSTRLPEIAGFLLLLVCLFRLVQYRLGAVFGGFAAALLLAGKSLPLATDARPYTLLLGFLALALLAWQRVPREPTRGGRRGLALTLLAAAVALMLLSHIFAVFGVAAMVAAEIVSGWRGRRPDWPVLAALVLPFSLIAVYIPMLENHGSAIYPEAFVPDGNTIFEFYIGLIDRQLVILCLVALTVLILFGRSHLRGAKPAAGIVHPWFFSLREWVAGIGLMLFPLVLMGYLMHSHGAFFARYGAAADLGVALLAAALLARWTAWEGMPDARVALLGIVLALLVSGVPMSAMAELASGRMLHPFTRSEPVRVRCEACELSGAQDADGRTLPLVDASGLTFVEMNQREPEATLSRLWYLTDPRASTELVHANIFERMPELVERFGLRGHSEPYAEFTRTHTHFYVLGQYDYPEDWLLRKLTADGASLRLVGHVQPAYRQVELYEVILAHQPPQ